MNKYKIGWAGLGNMGVPMALNIHKAGFNLAVYNRDAAKTKPLVDLGVEVRASAADLCRDADIVFTMLSDDMAVDTFYTDLLENDVTGKLFVNMSTISPHLAEKLAHVCAEKKAAYLDAPVSGSIKPATDGTLLILVGGKKDDFDKALPIFEKLGKRSILLGEAGAGSKAKLAINYYMSVVVTGIADTVLFAEQQGLGRDAMMQIINESACGSPMSAMKTSAVVNDQYPAAFPLKYMLKDIKLAKAEGLDSKLSDAMLDAYQKAANIGLSEKDLMAVIESYR